jgi:DtxR family Mn-dependent transcriptional regulator
MPDSLLSLLVTAIVAAAGALVFWPDRGLYWRWQQARRLTVRVLIEDALKHLHESEMAGRRATVQSLAGALQVTPDRVAELLPQMEERDLLHVEGDHYRLTPQGRDYALHVIRAHRLWEHYLAEHSGYATEEWHDLAHRQEHLLSPEAVEALSLQLNQPTYDPHGDPIPDAAGRMAAPQGQLLTTLAPDQAARIIHLEDEPPAVYAQLVALGLHPGLELRLLDSDPQRLRLWVDGNEQVLAPLVAANVTVLPLPDQALAEPVPTERLSDLKPGEKAVVSGLAQGCRGSERRRFLDLGILPGTAVEAEMISPSGDPTAYRVRGALLALRREQAEFIEITREGASR